MKCGQLSLRCYLGRCSSELPELVPVPFSSFSTCYSDTLHNFSVTIPICYKNVYVNRFFPCTVRLLNSLPIECFLLTYNLNGFKSRINRHLLTLGSLFLSKDISSMHKCFCASFSCNSMPCSGCSALVGVE